MVGFVPFECGRALAEEIASNEQGAPVRARQRSPANEVPLFSTVTLNS